MTQNIERINQWFRHVGEIILKLRWCIIIGLILIDVLAGIGIWRIQIDVSGESSLLKDDPLRVATDEFEAIFGNNDYVAILVEADDVFAPNILRMIRELGEELEENVSFAGEVVSLTDLEFTRGTEDGVEIGDIVPDEIPIDPAAIEAIRTLAFSKEFLVNRLFSDDSKQAWITLRLKPYPDDREATLEEFPQLLVGQQVLALLNQEKYKQYVLKPVGQPVMVYEEMDFFSHEANKLMIIAFFVGVFVLFVFLRSARGVVIPIITVISSVLWVFGAMGYLGITVDSMIITIPIFLGMAVSIGYSIHIFNFFRRRFFPTGKRQESVLYAIEETGWPIFFTAATTIGALLSFYFVPIRQVRWMGLSAASVVFTTYVIVMTFIPSLLSFGRDRNPKDGFNIERKDGHHLQGGAHLQSTHLALRKIDLWFEQAFTRLSNWILKHSIPIMIVFILLVIFFLGGLTQVYVSMNYEKSIGLDIPYSARYHYIGHSKIGSTNSYNVTLKFNEPDRVKDPEILKNFDVLISEVKQFPYGKRVSSLLDVIKDMNQVMHSDDPSYYRIPDDQALVAQLLLLYEMSEGTEQENWVDYEYTTLRLMVEVGGIDTAEINREFRYIEKRVKELFPGAKFGMVGGLVQVSVIQSYISKGEVVSFLIALFVIGILMIVVFRSVKTGLIGMIPNLAPVIVVGGLMGYLDIPLEMTTMMIIPMLLGLAVDDTIHFITHCKLEFQRAGNYQRSIEMTFKTVGKAIFMTSFILVAVFLVYMTSIARFFTNLSVLAISGVSSALLADYFITPILVNWAKPYGRAFFKSNN